MGSVYKQIAYSPRNALELCPFVSNVKTFLTGRAPSEQQVTERLGRASFFCNIQEASRRVVISHIKQIPDEIVVVNLLYVERRRGSLVVPLSCV